MKKIMAALCALLLMVPGALALADEAIIKPELPALMYPSETLALGTYSISPLPMEKDDALKMFLYEPVVFSKESLADLKVGDTVDLFDRMVTIRSLKKGEEEYVINEEEPEGFYLSAMQEDHNLYMARLMDDDYVVFHRLGLTEAPFAADFQFKDFRDVEKEEPVIGDLATFKELWATAYYNPDNLNVIFNDKGEIQTLCLYYSPNS